MQAALQLWQYFCLACGVLCLISFILYYLPFLYITHFCRAVNLKKKYNSEWALVTGGSSGIGKAIVHKLATQGLNVCIVALDDELLRSTVSEFSSQFPAVRFLPVAVDLSRDPEVYTSAISIAIDGLPISLVFNVAGFLVMGFFDERPIETHAANISVNLLAAIRITHLIYKKMIEAKRKGCIVFVSSAALYMPAPFASMYGCTKASLTHFAQSLAIEAEAHGIDVVVTHPSFTHTNLYAKTPKFGVINTLAKFGWQPSDVANAIFKSIGRCVVLDIGWYAVCSAYIGRIIDANALASLIIPFRDSMAPPGAVKPKRT